MATTEFSAPDRGAHPASATREARGLEIYRRGALERVSRNLYLVDSCSHRGDYLVDLAAERCECADSRRGHFCKHLYAATVYRAKLRRAARVIAASLSSS